MHLGGTLVEDIILHGIGSGADSRTPRELRNDFPSDKIYAPELPVHPKDAYNYICCMNDDFEWVVEKDGILYSRDKLDYSLYKGCSIWKVGKKIWEKLSDTKLNIEEKWVDYICWSNLFKIAPNMDNPTKMMKNAQFETCCDLLIREIEEYKPTHILFATGYEGWFYDKQNDFSKLFEIADKSVDDIVERKGIYVCETGVRIPVLVTQRPDSRKKGMTEKSIAIQWSIILKMFRDYI